MKADHDRRIKYKYFSLKKVFLLTVLIFELGNIICAVAPTSSLLILGRIVAGVGGELSSKNVLGYQSFIPFSPFPEV